MSHTTFIGTGLIGAGLAEAAIKRGERVKVWNRTAAKAEALGDMGAEVAATAADAVRGAARVHVTMTNDAALDSVLGNLFDALDADTVVVDHSTTSPDGTRDRAANCAERGHKFIHAPVFMSPNACRAAKGLMLAAGPKDAFDAVEAPMSLMTENLWYVGPNTADAATLKLAGNAMIVSMVAGLADAFAVAKSGGREAADVVELFNRFDPRGVINVRGGNMARGDYTTHWAASMAHKDVGLMCDAAGDLALAILPAITARLQHLMDAGEGGRDVGALGMHVVPPV